MTQVSKSKTVYQDREALRKKESTLFHLSRGWLPLQAGTLENIQLNFASGEYVDNTDKLVTEVKNDLALFSRVISRLSPSEESTNSTIDPMADLRRLDAEEIFNLLPKSSSQLTKHKIQRGTPSQKASLAASLLSATASETFAVQAKDLGTEVAPDDVISSSQLRQLGFNLLAWNYSTLFFKLVRTYKNNPDELDQAVYRNFGFTPLSIAEEYAKNWNLSIGLRASLKQTGLYQSVGTVKELCELGDIFGKTSQPSLFPAAKKEWEENTDRLKDLIGTDNTAEIKEKIESCLEDRLKNLLKSEPEQFNSAFTTVRPSEAPTSIYFSSPILNQLPEELRQTYRPIYDQLLDSEPRLPILKELTEKVIPASGFLRGAIYLQSEDSEELKVKIEVGKIPESRSQAASFDETAGEAIGSQIPLLNREKLGTRISSAFHSNSHSGVIVLELDKELEDAPDRNNILLFKAARECLMNCLG